MRDSPQAFVFQSDSALASLKRESPYLRQLPQYVFQSDSALASLKPAGHDDACAAPRVFQSDSALASLKQLGQLVLIWLDLRVFQSDSALASLKPLAVGRCGICGARFPERFRSGLIEAEAARLGRHVHRGFPERFRSGLIEARSARDWRSSLPARFPERFRSGLIEARMAMMQELEGIRFSRAIPLWPH